MTEETRDDPLEGLEVATELAQFSAVTWRLFQALLHEGFTESQALAITIARVTPR